MRSPAHGAHLHEGGSLWSQWHWDPLILLNLLLLATLYFIGYRTLRKKGVVERALGTKQAVFFALSLAVCFIALISPVVELSANSSWAHMIQHLLLMAVAAPLFVAGAPMLIIFQGLPSRFRKRIATLTKPVSFFSRSRHYFYLQPLLLWLLFALVLWIWHLPSLYDFALERQWAHDIQHITFFAAAALFWRALLDPVYRLKLGRGVALIYIFATSLHATLLGALMTLSPFVWYRSYEREDLLLRLAPMEDQQLAGLIMWMPACAAYILATAYVFHGWIVKDAPPRSKQ